MSVCEEISQPSIIFNNPNEILLCKKLSREEKLKALENWKMTCIQLQKSTSEGMQGENLNTDLRGVVEAIRRLKDKESYSC